MPNPIFLIWKKAPFIRWFICFALGIILQWHFSFPAIVCYGTLLISFILLFGSFFLPQFIKFKYNFLIAIVAYLVFITAGATYTFQRDIRHQSNWVGHYYQDQDFLLVTLTENLVEKSKSFKANATIENIFKGDSIHSVTGEMILYFQKDSTALPLKYGNQLIIHQPIQEIKNAGNPGGFDYKRYCLFEGITHQAFLKPSDYEILETEKTDALQRFLIATRNWVLAQLRTYIEGEKELGLAEALLIGYKDDLDQNLLQSYTNTGVVHVIAISGLHLGIIYILLIRLLNPLKKRKGLKWLVPVITILGLWLFSLLAGAQPSILRAAVMFSCMVLGESISKRSSIYNNLALSAFILLLINPFWLWNVGFQLSYAAVLSIVIFQRAIYHWFYFPNKIIDFFWQLISVTLAAQLITTPISIYHFHQFPLYFLIANIVAVPISSIILIMEIVLCVISFFDSLAKWVGLLLSWLITQLNHFIEQVERMPNALWDGLQISILQTILLLLTISFLSYSIFEKKKNYFFRGIFIFLCFLILRAYSFYQTEKQIQLIVYNVPQKTAIDYIEGRNYFFKGDSSLLEDAFHRNFHLKPARVKHRLDNNHPTIWDSTNWLSYHHQQVLFLSEKTQLVKDSTKPLIDLVIISGNPKLYMTDLVNVITPKQIVFDGSCPNWKMNYWKKDLDSLQIAYHDVKQSGAFIKRFDK